MPTALARIRFFPICVLLICASGSLLFTGRANSQQMLPVKHRGGNGGGGDDGGNGGPPPPPGQNEHGVLLFHAPIGLAYCADIHDYRGQSGITSCYDFVAEASNNGVFFVMAAFPPGASARVSGVTFGIAYDDQRLVMLDRGTCGDFELPMPTWPTPLSGTAVTWNTPQTSRLFEVYWMCMYQYYLEPQMLSLIPHPGHGGSFGDDALPSNITTIENYGKLGFGMCPIQDFAFCGLGECPPSGACCASNGTCTYVRAGDCVHQYMGDGIPCDPTPCPNSGACCVQGGTGCIVLDETICISAGGTFIGEGTRCPVVDPRVILEGNGRIFVHIVDPPIICDDEPALARGGPCPPDGPYFDPWTSDAADEMCHNFGVEGSPPIPADFFDPGSEPFAGSVCLQGIPLGIPEYPEADTVIERDADPFDACDLPSSIDVEVAIQVALLSLESVDPVTVIVNGSPETWNVFVDLSEVPAPVGILSARKTHCNGGTYTSTLYVQPRFTFTRIGDGAIRVLDTGLAGTDPVILDQPDPAQWVSDIGIFGGSSDRCSAFHAGFESAAPNTDCDCNENGINDVCDIRDAFVTDCNVNGIPDSCDVAVGRSADQNGDQIPDECNVASTVPPSEGGEWLSLQVIAAPNPFSGHTAIRYELTRAAIVRLEVFAADGRKVTTLSDGQQAAGAHTMQWDGHDSIGRPAAAGVYFARLEIEGIARSTRFVVLR